MIIVNKKKMAAGCDSSPSGKSMNWGFSETKLLISIWAEEDIQCQLSSMGRKKNIWFDIAAKLRRNGYQRTGEQCKTRMHNLQRKYKKVKSLNNTTGQEKNSCAFFDELDKVLGHKPSINPSSILESRGGKHQHGRQEDAMDTESVSEEEEHFLIEAATADSVPAGKSTVSSEDECVGELSSSKKSKAKSNGKAKKRKQPKAKAAADKMENFMEKFFHLQQESEQRFLEYEERRAKQEAEQEEKRRQFEAEQDSKRENFLLTVLQTLAKNGDSGK